MRVCAVQRQVVVAPGEGPCDDPAALQRRSAVVIQRHGTLAQCANACALVLEQIFTVELLWNMAANLLFRFILDAWCVRTPCACSCACACACAHAYVRECVHACVRACVRAWYESMIHPQIHQERVRRDGGDGFHSFSGARCVDMLAPTHECMPARAPHALRSSSQQRASFNFGACVGADAW